MTFSVKKLVTIAGLLALSASSLFAGAIATNGSWEEFKFGTVGSFGSTCSGACGATTDPIADNSVDAPWTFSGAAVLQVVDLYLEGDQFEVFDNSIALGDTSVPSNAGGNDCANDIGCAVSDANYSYGEWSLGAGSHSITIEAIQDAAGFSDGAAALSVGGGTPTPEPGTVALLFAGLGVLGLGRRARRRA